MKTHHLLSRIFLLFPLSLPGWMGGQQATGANLAFSSLPQENTGIEMTDKTLSPYFVVLSDDPETDRMPLQETHAVANIAGVIADVTVTQVYKNEGKNVLEAIYVFPASTRAAVYDMRMKIGEREVVAVIQEKQQARQLYEQARAQGKTASLLEQMRPNVFQMNVANILPGDLIRVELKYTELLVPEKGIYSFVYPTVVGPRYNNSTGEEAGAGEQWIANPYTTEGLAPSYAFGMEVNLSTGIPIKEAFSPSHRVQVKYQSKTRAVISLDESEKSGGNRDFILRYRLSGGQIESGILLFEGAEENFFLAMIQPPEKVNESDIPPREYIFILDVSGSMHGFPLDISKELMQELLGGLRPVDRFNVLFFAGGSSLYAPASVPATRENIQSALNMVNNQQGGGGTELLNALERALKLPGTEGYARSFVIATDGYVSVEKESFDLIRNNLGEANFFPFGIGSSVNRHLIEGMAHVGMGSPVILTSEQEARQGARRFREYIERPVLTNIRVNYGGFEVYDVEPGSVPDVLAERPVILFGKWRGRPEGKIRLSGKSGNKTYEQTLEVSRDQVSDKHAGLAYLWAREKIRLLDDYSLVGEDTKQEVTEVGLAYNLLTRYTSFVAVDTEIRNATGNSVTVRQPLPLPEGVSNYAIGGVTAAAPGLRKSVAATEQRYRGELETDAISPGREDLPEEQSLFYAVEKMPAFQGGMQALEKFIRDRLVYPESLLNKPINGKVLVEFIVEEDGSIKEIRIARGLHPLLDREALRVIRLSSGQWIPGMQKGKPVRVKMILPVEFRR